MQCDFFPRLSELYAVLLSSSFPEVDWTRIFDCIDER